MPEAKSQKPGALFLWAPVLAYMALIFVLSSISHPPPLPGQTDKGAHAILYAGLGLLFARALTRGWRGVTPRTLLYCVIFGAVYGASDEFHQYFNPPRDAEVLDVVADTIGSGIGAAALYAWGIIRDRDGV
jgi:VanZ family protein